MRFVLIACSLFMFTGAKSYYTYPNKTAEDVANYCATHGLRHIGGNPSYEGLGCASTPEAAYRGCCFGSRTDLITYDSAIVQASNGLWVACRRYVHKSQAHLVDYYRELAGLRPSKKDENGDIVFHAVETVVAEKIKDKDE